jgi:hypothetical protein
MSEQEAAYKNATGRPLPAIPNFFAQLLITTNRHTKGLQVHSSLLVADPCDLLFFSLSEYQALSYATKSE